MHLFVAAAMEGTTRWERLLLAEAISEAERKSREMLWLNAQLHFVRQITKLEQIDPPWRMIPRNDLAVMGNYNRPWPRLIYE